MFDFTFKSSQLNSILNISLACLLMLLVGSISALGVFTIPIETFARPKENLDGVWTSSIAIISWCSIATSIFSAFYLDAGLASHSDPYEHQPIPLGLSKTHRIKILSFLVAISFSALAIVARAVQSFNPQLIRLSASLLAVPLGSNYIVATELLLAWAPANPRLAISCGQIALNGGTIIISSLYHHLIVRYGCVHALRIASLIFTALSTIPLFLLRWPHCYDQTIVSTPLASTPTSHTLTPLYTRNIHLPWHEIRTTHQFWAFLFVAFTSAAPYAFQPFFFKLAIFFHPSTAQMLQWFHVAVLLSSLFGVIAINVTDHLGFKTIPFLRSGAKTVLIVLFSLQSLLYMALIPLSKHPNFVLFFSVVSIQIVITSAYGGCMAILARDSFGTANTMIAFGLAAGIGVGAGEGASTELMTIVESLALRRGGRDLVLENYIPYFVSGAVWSVAGVLALMLVSRCERAFELLPTRRYGCSLETT